MILLQLSVSKILKKELSGIVKNLLKVRRIFSMSSLNLRNERFKQLQERNFFYHKIRLKEIQACR